MTNLSKILTTKVKKQFNDDIEKKVNGIRDMQKVAKEVTLTEFIEQYSSKFDYITLGSLWYSVNQSEIDRDFAEELNISYGGTDPE